MKSRKIMVFGISVAVVVLGFIAGLVFLESIGLIF
jgi:hypothetical protein